jgi:hypothetical protein
MKTISASKALRTERRTDSIALWNYQWQAELYGMYRTEIHTVPRCFWPSGYAGEIGDKKSQRNIESLAYFKMIQKYGMKPRVGRSVSIKQNYRISLHKRSNVENIDLEFFFWLLRV